MSTMNMALYRLLLKQGATEQEAEQAASIDVAVVATKADLAELKASLLMWIIMLLIAQTGLVLTVIRAMLP